MDRTGSKGKNKIEKKPSNDRPPFNPLNLLYKKPGDAGRTVPAGNRDTAVGVSKIILEHVYWLGIAIKENNKRAAQNEVDCLARFATAYAHFASDPSEKPLKFSTSDNYPDNIPYKKRQQDKDSDDSESETADLDN